LNPNSIDHAEIAWLYYVGEKKGKFEIYKLTQGSVIIDKEYSTIRMKFYSTDINADEPFEFIIKQKGSNYYYKTDTYDIPEEEYEIYPHKADDGEIIFYTGDSEEEIYLHIAIE